MNTPLLSIVIANYNYGRFLDEAIQSVLSQSCDDYDLIIIDGDSTDNSVEVIKKYAGGLPANTMRDVGESKSRVEVEQRNCKDRVEVQVEVEERKGGNELKLKCEVEERNCNRLRAERAVGSTEEVGGGVPSAPFNERLAARHCSISTLDSDSSLSGSRLRLNKITYWCSEPDKGQSDAFNKGFARARGKYLTWLNADDVMLPGVIEKLKKASEKHPECEWFVGGCFWLDPEMRIINCGRGRPFSEIRYREGNVSVWGPSSFFTKRLLDTVGGVDVRFCYAMDMDLWLRFACKENARYRPFCKYAWGLRFHPDSKTTGSHFSLEGKLDADETTARERIDAKHLAQCQQESVWKDSYFTRKKGTWFTQLISINWWSVLLARLDLLKWRGKKYTEVM